MFSALKPLISKELSNWWRAGNWEVGFQPGHLLYFYFTLNTEGNKTCKALSCHLPHAKSDGLYVSAQSAHWESTVKKKSHAVVRQLSSSLRVWRASRWVRQASSSTLANSSKPALVWCCLSRSHQSPNCSPCLTLSHLESSHLPALALLYWHLCVVMQYFVSPYLFVIIDDFMKGFIGVLSRGMYP